MTTIPPPTTVLALPATSAQELQDLRERTQYEAWFLDEVYELREEQHRAPVPSELVYPADGSPAQKVVFLAGQCIIGDWRPGFLAAGAPLIFTTAFKLLDMLVEWILVRNGCAVKYQWEGKLKSLDAPIRLPLGIAQPWLRERLVGLYRILGPLRGTIIHHRHFASADGSLRVSSSKKGVVGEAVTLNASDIRTLARTVVHTVRLITGELHLDRLAELQMRHSLDCLVHLHGEPLLLQRQPEALVMKKVLLFPSKTVWFDLEQVRNDAARLCPNTEPVLLRLEVLEQVPNGSVSTRWSVPWECLRGHGAIVEFARDDLARFLVVDGGHRAPPSKLAE